MVKYLTIVSAVALFALGLTGCNQKSCLEKEGFKNCEDFQAAAAKSVGNDEAYRFHTIAKKCGCENTAK